jgi:uncharacterized protein YyaL (SSP411 family)
MSPPLLASLLVSLVSCRQAELAPPASSPPAEEVQSGAHRSPMRHPLPAADVIAALPRDGGDEFNRLVFEASPYLQQHARNPVDWYPWGDEAFRVAAERDVPVFLSIGYSTCHWCHVMEHESFEDSEVAASMNAAFVCVKVDREERPDVDHVYMTVTQALTGSGGWPMTVLLTAERQPFFAATYLPKSSRGQRMGMLEFVPAVQRAWREDRERLLASAKALTDELAALTRGAPGAMLGEDTLARAEAQLASSFDAQHGGFGTQMKFPVPHNLRFLLRRHARTGSTSALEMVERTLRAWRLGGVYDHVGFGIHRYATDREWLVPHFEKMLYDQALATLAYVEAWQVTHDAEHEQVAREILTYVTRDMTSPAGGFYSAEDADSEGEEGLFYLWTSAELETALGADDAAFVARMFGCTAEGNYRDEATGERTGRNILHLTRPLGERAADLGLEPSALDARWESLRARLFEAREKRVHPLKDDKVLTDWNGLMIAAFAAAGRAFDDESLLVHAQRAADFCLRELRTPEGRLLKRWRNGEAALPGLLDDYAFLVYGLVELFQADQDPRWLRAALELTDVQIKQFLDPELGGFFLSPRDGEALIVRGKEVYDGALPSGNSITAHNLVRLARLTGDTELEEFAALTVRAFSGGIGEQPASYTQLLAAVDFLVGPSFELVVAGDPGAEDTHAARAALGRVFAPNAVTLLRPDGEAPEVTRFAPYTAAQVAQGGRATLYLCRNFACEAPTSDVESVVQKLTTGARATPR